MNSDKSIRYQIIMDWVKLVFMLGVTALIITGLVLGFSPKKTNGEKENEFVFMSRGQEAVMLKLKDPDSAQFMDLFVHRGFNNVRVTCGKVNAKNSFGGYTGYKKFISAGSSTYTFLEDEVKDFPDLWLELCIKSAK